MIKYIIISKEDVMKVTRINAGEFGSNCWLVIDEETRKSVVIDPSPEISIIKEALDRRGAEVETILLTHSHFDHMTSIDSLRDVSGAPLCVHKLDADGIVNSFLNCSRVFMNDDMVYRPAEILLSDGDTVKFGQSALRVMHTPGHTPGSVCFIGHGAVFSGDTLFDGSIGRCDLPGGSDEQMAQSLLKLKFLDGDFIIYSGHGSVTTLEKQRAYNPYIK